MTIIFELNSIWPAGVEFGSRSGQILQEAAALRGNVCAFDSPKVVWLVLETEGMGWNALHFWPWQRPREARHVYRGAWSQPVAVSVLSWPQGRD